MNISYKVNINIMLLKDYFLSVSFLLYLVGPYSKYLRLSHVSENEIWTFMLKF